MVKEQVYATIGRMAIKKARELKGGDFCPRDSMDDCTIQILGMADMFDEMDKLGLFEDEIATQSQEHFDQDYIWWRDVEDVKPKSNRNVLVWNWDTSTERSSVERGFWNGDCWLIESDDSKKNVLYWAPLNPPEENIWA